MRGDACAVELEFKTNNITECTVKSTLFLSCYGNTLINHSECIALRHTQGGPLGLCNSPWQVQVKLAVRLDWETQLVHEEWSKVPSVGWHCYGMNGLKETEKHPQVLLQL